MYFQALARCLRPTTDFETLRKYPKWVFQFVKDKNSSVNADKYVILYTCEPQNTGETSPAITPFHFFGYSNFSNFYHEKTSIT